MRKTKLNAGIFSVRASVLTMLAMLVLMLLISSMRVKVC